MTEPEQPQPAGEDTPEGAEQPSTTDDGNKEAAKYRRRLRDTEKERDSLRERLDTLQRGEVERLAADRLADSADVWRDGATLDTLLDDAGNIDGDKVNNLVGELLQAHAHWGVKVTPAPSASGLKSGAMATEPPKESTWARALKAAPN